MDTVLLMDIVVGAVFLISVFAGGARGLYKSLMPLMVTVAAMVGAVLLSNVLTPVVTEAVYPKVEDKVVENLRENLAELQEDLLISAEADVIGGKVKELLPESLLKLGEKFGALEEDLSSFAQNVGESAGKLLTPEQREKLQGIGVELREETESAAEGVRVAVFAAAFETAHRLTESIVRWVIRILGFILLYVLFTLLKNAFRFTVDLPVISWVDWLGGAALGAVECAAVLLIAGWLLDLFGVTALHELSEGTKIAHFFF